MVLHTRLCDLLEIEHPVLNAPMGGGDAPAGLAAAVSEAGGLGLIGGTTMGGSEWLIAQIRRTRELTDRPFGVGFISHLRGASELMRVALGEGVGIVAHSFADPEPFVDIAHRAGALVLCQVRTLDAARRAAAVGVDVVTAQGTEAGGHTGKVSTFALLPAVVDAVEPVPVIAAGGIADGRGLAAALMLGADGVWVGTRFLATPEAGVSEEHKQDVLRATTDDTALTDVFDIANGIDWPDGVAGRAVRNEFVERWDGREEELRAWAREQRDDQHARGAYEGAHWAGEASSLVTRIEPAADVVRGLVADATALLRARPQDVLRGP